MKKYQVHYRRNEKYWSGVLKGRRTVEALSEAEAVAQVAQDIPDSYGHFVEV